MRRAAELDQAIEAWTSGRSSDDVLSILREAKIPAGGINTRGHRRTIFNSTHATCWSSQ